MNEMTTTMTMIDRRRDPRSCEEGGTASLSTPPMQSSRRIAAVRLQVRWPSSCHQHADLAPAYAITSRQTINPLPGPALLLPLSSRTVASLSLSPPTGDRVFRLPPEGGGGWCRCALGHGAVHIYGFLAVKKHQVLFPATTEQNITLVNLFRKPSVLTHLMAIVALVTISSIHLL
jgi:hypothetical protein